jgi:hypothetical protein
MSKQDQFLARAGKILLPESGGSMLKTTVDAHSKASVQSVLPTGYCPLDRIVVIPRMPPQYMGSIAVSRKSRLVEIALTQVGQIHYMGPAAYTARTADGVDYNLHPFPKIGDWVFYKPKAGSPMLIKRSEEQGLDSSESTRMLIMEDRDVLFVFTDEAQSKMVWSWLQ